MKYIDFIRGCGVGVDGQCTKLENISSAIRYLEINNLIKSYKNLNNVKEIVRNWKKSLRKEKIKCEWKNYQKRI